MTAASDVTKIASAIRRSIECVTKPAIIRNTAVITKVLSAGSAKYSIIGVISHVFNAQPTGVMSGAVCAVIHVTSAKRSRIAHIAIISRRNIKCAFRDGGITLRVCSSNK